MNPNFVLSEEERQKRFRKRKNTDDDNGRSVVSPVMTVRAITSVAIGKPAETFVSKEVQTNDIPDQKSLNGMNAANISNAEKEVIDEDQYNFTSNENCICSGKDPINSNNGQQFTKCKPSDNYAVIHTNVSIQKVNCNSKRVAVIQKVGTQEPKQKIFIEEENKTYKCPPFETFFAKNEGKNFKDLYSFNLNQNENRSQGMEETLQLESWNSIPSTCFEDVNVNEIANKQQDAFDTQNLLQTTTVDLYDSTNEQTETEEDTVYSMVIDKEPELIFSEDEKLQLDQMVKNHDSVYHSVNFGEVLIKEMLMCSMFGVPVSTSAAIQGYRLQVERITRIANDLTLFTELDKVDQVALLKENADLLVSLRGAIFFDRKKPGMDQVMSSMGEGDLDLLNTMFKPMLNTHRMNHIEYRVFNSIQDPAAKKIEERYSFLQGKVADAILSNIISILITYIILFSSDFCSLQNRKKVEKTQHQYLRILERFVYSSCNRMSACSKIGAMLNAITCVREMADIKKSRTINHSATAQVTK